VFSSNFVISAASGDDTICTAPAVCANKLAAFFPHAAVAPPTTRGVRPGA
jgi:hypothetical protein